MKAFKPRLMLLPAALALGSCGEHAALPVAAGIGPHPVLPPPDETLIPTVNVAPAIGWPAGAAPVAAQGTTVALFAEGLDHPRWLYVLPNGDVLVAETNAPPRPEDGSGIKGWVMKLLMKKAGARGAERRTASRCCAMPTATASRRRARFPRGAALAVRHGAGRRRPLRRQHRRHRALPLRRGRDADHARRRRRWSICRPARSITTGPRTSSPAATARSSTRPSGSNSNVAEHGMEEEEGRAAIWEIDRATGASIAFSPPACAIRSGWPGSRRPARCGPPSTSATSSAAISCPTT